MKAKTASTSKYANTAILSWYPIFIKIFALFQFCAVEKKIKQILSQVEKVKNNERERSDLLKELVNLSSNQL